MSENKKIRYGYIDLLKFIAIIMVIILHSTILKTGFIENNKDIKNIIQYIIRIACEGVPIFILANGFLLFSKKEIVLRKHINKILKIFVLLIIWSIINILIQTLILRNDLNIKLIIRNILTTDINNKYTGPLWFLQDLIGLYFIFPVLKYLYDTNLKIFNYLFIIVALFTVGLNFINVISIIIVKLTNFKEIALLTNYIQKFNIISKGEFILFFMLGGYLYKYKDKFKESKFRIKIIIIGVISWIIAFFCAYIISILDNKTYMSSFNYHSIFMIFMLLALFAICYKYEDKNKFYNKIINIIGKNSLGIFLCHKIIIVFIMNYINISDLNYFWKTLFIPLILAISLIVTIVISKIPIVKNLVKL